MMPTCACAATGPNTPCLGMLPTSSRPPETWSLTVERSESQWVDLREALANERISAADGVDPDANAHALLTQLRADPTVNAAASNLNANLIAVSASFNTAINN